MANSGRFEYTIGFKTDDKGLRDARKALQEIQNLTINSPGMSDKSGFLENAKKSAAELELALTKAYNVKMGTTSVAKLNTELNNLKTPLNKIYEDMVAIGPKGEAAFNKIAAQAMKTNLQIKQGNIILNKFGKTLWRNVEWLISGNLINTVTGVFTKAYGFTKNLDSSLNDIRIVTGKSADEMARFGKEAQETAAKLGKGTTDITNASLIFYQQGLDREEVDARTEVTAKMANVTKQSADVVADQMTAIWNGFRAGSDELEHYADVMTAIAASTASSSQELAGSISKVASIANTTGVDMEQLSAMISTVISVTRDSPETVGTAFKTIFARINDLVEDGTDEFGVSLGRISSHLANMGIEILNEDGTLRNLGNTLTETGEKWKSYSREQQIAIAEQMGGKRQWNQVLALFDNWDKYKNALDVARDSTGALQKQQDIYMDSTEAHLQAVKTAWEGVYGEMMTADNINTVADFFTDLLEKVQSFIQAVGGMKPLLTSVAGILMTSFSSQIGQSIGNIALNFQRMSYNARELSAQNQLIAQFGKLESPLMKELADNHQKILQYQSSMTEQQRQQYESLLDIRVEAENEYKAIKEQDDALKGLLTKYEQIGEIQKQNNSLSETTDAIQQRAGALETMRENEGFETKSGRLVSLDWTDNDHKQTIDSLKIVNAIEQEIVKRQEQAIKLKEQMVEQTGKQKEATRKQAKEEETIVKYLREAADIARENAHRRATEKGNPSLPSKAAKTIEEVQQKITNKYQGNHDDVVDLVKNLNDVLGKTSKPAESAKQKIDLIKASLEKLGKQGALTEKDVQNLKDKYDAFGQTISKVTSKETLIEGFGKLKQEVLATGAVSEEEFTKMIQMLQDGVPQAADTAKAHLEAAKKATKEFFEQLDFQNKIKNITTAIGAVGQLAGAIQSLKNLGSIWDNKDLTTGEKLLQTVQNLGFVIPMLTTSVMNLTKSLFANAGALTVEMLAEKGVVLQKGAHLTVTQLLTIAQVALNAALKANPIGLVITAIAALVLAMKGLLSILNKATKITGGWRAATVALGTGIGALFLGPIGAAIGLTAGLIANFWQLKDAEEAERKAMIESSKAKIEANKELLETAKAQQEAIQSFKDAYDAYEKDRNKLSDLTTAVEAYRQTLSSSEQKQLDHLKHIADITGNYDLLRDAILGVEAAVQGTENKISEENKSNYEKLVAAEIEEGSGAENFKEVKGKDSISDFTGKSDSSSITVKYTYNGLGNNSGEKREFGTEEEATEWYRSLSTDEQAQWSAGSPVSVTGKGFVVSGSSSQNFSNIGKAYNTHFNQLGQAMAQQLVQSGLITEKDQKEVANFLTSEFKKGNFSMDTLQQAIQSKWGIDPEKMKKGFANVVAETMQDWDDILLNSENLDVNSSFYQIARGAINFYTTENTQGLADTNQFLDKNKIEKAVSETTKKYENDFKKAVKMSKEQIQLKTEEIYKDLLSQGLDSEDARDQAEQIVQGFFSDIEGGMTEAAKNGILSFNNGEIVKTLVNGVNLKSLKTNFEEELKRHPIKVDGKDFYIDVENLSWEGIQQDINNGSLKKEDIFNAEGQLNVDTKSLQILASYSQEYQNLGNNVATTTTNFEQLNGTIDSLNEKIEKKNIKNLDKDSDWKALQESESDLRILFKDNEEMLEKMDILFDPSKYGTDEWYEAFHRVADGIRSSGTIEAFNEMSKVENDFLNEHRTIQEEIGGKTDFQVKMEVDGDEYEDYMEKITDADYKVNVQVQVENSRELKDLKNELNSTIGLAGKIGEGFIVSRDDLFELAEAYPALLKNAQHMTDGTIKLNEASVKDFIDAKKKEFQAEVEAKRQKILAQIEILKHKKETYDKMADIGARMASGAIDTEEDLVEVTGQLDAHNEDLKIANHYLTNQEDSKLMEANVDDFNKSGKKIVDSNRSFWQQVVDDRAAILSGQAITDSYNPDDFKWSSDSWDDLIGFINRKDLGNGHYLADYWGAIDEIKNRGQDIYDKFHKLSEETQGLIDDEYASLDSLNLYEKAGLDAFNNIGKVTDATKDNTKAEKDAAEAQQELLDLLNEEIDAYHDVTQQIERHTTALNRLQKAQEKATGKTLIKNLQDQMKAYQDLNNDYADKQFLQYEEAAAYRVQLEEQGVAFDENGVISNYSDILNQKQKEINADLAWYNSLSAEDQEAQKDWIESRQAEYDSLVDLIGNYDQLWNQDIPDLADEIAENIDKQVELELEIKKQIVQIEVDKGSLKRMEMELNKTLDNVQEKDLERNLAYNIQSYFTYSDEEKAKLKRYLEAKQKKDEADTSGEDLSAADLENYREALEDYNSIMQEKAKQANEIISSAFDGLNEKIERQKTQFETMSKLFEHDMNLIKLRYGDQAFEQLKTLYAAREENAKAQLSNANLALEVAQKELAAAQAKGDLDLVQAAQDKVTSALEAQRQAVIDGINAIQDTAMNTVDAIFAHLDEQVAGVSFEKMKKQWDDMEKDSADYYDAINGAYEIEKLRTNMKKAINESGSAATQKALNNLMNEEITKLQQKDKLSKYDIERANALFDIEQKRAAFREAQNNKSKMRLRRDASGNYSYQFVSDEDKVTSAIQDLADAQNQLYNIDKEAYKNNLEKMQEYYLEYQEEMKAAANASAEERQAIEDRYMERVAELQEENRDASRNLIQDVVNDSEILTGKSIENIEDMTQAEVDALMGSAIPAWKSYLGVMSRSKDLLADMKQAGLDASQVFDTSKAKIDIEMALNGLSWDSLIEGFDPAVENIKTMTSSTNEIAQEVKNISAGVSQFIEAIKSNNFTEGLEKFVMALENGTLITPAINILPQRNAYISSDNMDTIVDSAASPMDRIITSYTQLKGEEARARRDQLIDNGVIFDADGIINNYAEIIKQKQLGLSADSAWSSSLSGEDQEIQKDWIESRQAEYDNLIDLISGYDQLWNRDIPALTNEITKIAEEKTSNDLQERVSDLIDNSMFVSETVQFLADRLSKVYSQQSEILSETMDYLHTLSTAKEKERELQEYQPTVVNINADFPAVTSQHEIEQALDSLVARATQRAYRTVR